MQHIYNLYMAAIHYFYSLSITLFSSRKKKRVDNYVTKCF